MPGRGLTRSRRSGSNPSAAPNVAISLDLWLREGDVFRDPQECRGDGWFRVNEPSRRKVSSSEAFPGGVKLTGAALVLGEPGWTLG